LTQMAKKAPPTKEEIDQFMMMGSQLAGKAVLHALMAVITDGPKKGYSAKESKRLKNLIEKTVPFPYSGYLQCDFGNDFGKDFPKLNISLSLVKNTYTTNVELPQMKDGVADRYSGDVLSKCMGLRNISIAYWRQYAGDHPALYADIVNYRPDLDFSEIHEDTKRWLTLYFDPACEYRVGVYAYYVDSAGKPMLKIENKNQ
jgi:hypothetical protein